MQVDVWLTGHALHEEVLRERTAVVIDVLRASSTIVTALERGARAVIPVADMAQAGKIAFNLAPDTYLLGGEREGLKIEGYHLGNSPLEYVPEKVKNRIIILNTSNGTGLIERAKEAAEVIVAGFLNAQAVVEYVRRTGRDVALLCAGNNDRVALEDSLCAGLLTARLWGNEEPLFSSDGARIAYTLYARYRDHLADVVSSSEHARHLKRLGFEADIAYCTHLDVSSIVPVYEENRLIARTPSVQPFEVVHGK